MSSIVANDFEIICKQVFISIFQLRKSLKQIYLRVLEENDGKVKFGVPSGDQNGLIKKYSGKHTNFGEKD
jgi:hypothetical protein